MTGPWRRKLRRCAEPALVFVEIFRELGDGLIEFRFADRGRGGVCFVL